MDVGFMASTCPHGGSHRPGPLRSTGRPGDRGTSRDVEFPRWRVGRRSADAPEVDAPVVDGGLIARLRPPRLLHVLWPSAGESRIVVVRARLRPIP